MSQAFADKVGDVTVSAQTLSMDAGLIQTSTIQTGDAGNISVNVGTLSMTNGAQIVTSAALGATGRGGDLTVNATNSISISGSSPTGEPVSTFNGSELSSGLFSTASESLASDAKGGGQITVSTPKLFISKGGKISAVSPGSGPAGDINIVISDSLQMDGGTITTAAASAAGGDITITQTITHTGSLVNLQNSQITTSVNGGLGGGGNITIGAQLDPATLQPQNINPFEFIALNNSGIHANAFGGPGGNINIFSDFLVSSLPISTAITASSALSTPGAINIQAIVVDVSKDVVQLPDELLQATALMRAACAARFVGGKTSSLVLGSRDGLPLQPGGLMPSPLYFANKAGAPASTTSYELPRFSLLQPANQGLSWYQYSLLANSRCS